MTKNRITVEGDIQNFFDMHSALVTGWHGCYQSWKDAVEAKHYPLAKLWFTRMNEVNRMIKRVSSV